MLIWLGACIVLTPQDLDAHTDADGDGWPAAGDCDDDDPTISPSVPESCDGLDNDCSGAADDGLLPDRDGDGYGDDSPDPGACFADWIPRGGDCDDDNPEVFPGQAERCNDIDDGCRDGWTPADEAGLVTWIGGDAVEDWTAAFSAGSAQSPAAIALPTEGALHICPAEAPWSVHLTATEPAGLQLIGHDRPTLSGPSGTVLSVVGGALSVAGLQLSGGTAVRGAGIDARGVDSLSVEDCLIQGNIAIGSDGPGGAGVSLDAVEVADFIDTTFSSNVAGDPLSGGGLSIRDSAVTLSGCRFEDNYAYLSGGGVQLWSGTLTVEDTDLVDNQAALSGGAFAGGADSTAHFDGARFSGSAASSGAALRIAGDVTLSECTFTGPAASALAAVAYLDPGARLEAAGVTASGVSVPEANGCIGDVPRYPDLVVSLAKKPACDEVILCAIDADTFACGDGACPALDCQAPL